MITKKGYEEIIYIFILEEYNIKQFQCYMIYWEDITYYLTTANNWFMRLKLLRMCINTKRFLERQ